MTEMPAVVPHACLQCNLSDADQFSFRHSGAKQIKLADKISNIFHLFRFFPDETKWKHTNQCAKDRPSSVPPLPSIGKLPHV